ncbi:hypothetical protein [Sphingomonas melonis]|uniref:hypothetical protein n=1 Tax=Sphingomonas melonis TaxID=152682 RepID=UPI001F1F07E8|nr:hypothetical protein [Sphingomonas melonis]
MNPDQTAHVRAHVAAVSKLLLGNKIMNPGLMIMAGGPLDPHQRIAFVAQRSKPRSISSISNSPSAKTTSP